jgi:hypothetical protein
LNRWTWWPSLPSQSKSAEKRGSLGSTSGPQTPVEQHIGGSKIWMVAIAFSLRKGRIKIQFPKLCFRFGLQQLLN